LASRTEYQPAKPLRRPLASATIAGVKTMLRFENMQPAALWAQ
jgi:hypothetical protein